MINKLDLPSGKNGMARLLRAEFGGGGSSGPKESKVSIPKQQSPQSFYMNRDGQAMAQTVQKGNNVYSDVFSTPEEKAQRQYFSNLFSQIGPQIAQTPEARTKQIDDYGNSLYAQLKQPLDEERANALLRNKENFNARGLLGSTPQADYQAKNIDSVYSKGLTDAKNQSIFGREDLASQNEQRLLRLLATATGGLQGDLSNMLGMNQAGFQGYMGANQNANQRYANALQAAGLQMQQNQYNNQLRSQQGGGGGFGQYVGPAIQLAGLAFGV